MEDRATYMWMAIITFVLLVTTILVAHYHTDEISKAPDGKISTPNGN